MRGPDDAVHLVILQGEDDALRVAHGEHCRSQDLRTLNGGNVGQQGPAQSLVLRGVHRSAVGGDDACGAREGGHPGDVGPTVSGIWGEARPVRTAIGRAQNSRRSRPTDVTGEPRRGGELDAVLTQDELARNGDCGAGFRRLPGGAAVEAAEDPVLAAIGSPRVAATATRLVVETTAADRDGRAPIGANQDVCYRLRHEPEEGRAAVCIHAVQPPGLAGGPVAVRQTGVDPTVWVRRERAGRQRQGRDQVPGVSGIGGVMQAARDSHPDAAIRSDVGGFDGALWEPEKNPGGTPILRAVQTRCRGREDAPGSIESHLLDRRHRPGTVPGQARIVGDECLSAPEDPDLAVRCDLELRDRRRGRGQHGPPHRPEIESAHDLIIVQGEEISVGRRRDVHGVAHQGTAGGDEERRCGERERQTSAEHNGEAIAKMHCLPPKKGGSIQETSGLAIAGQSSPWGKASRCGLPVPSTTLSAGVAAI